MPPSDPGPPPRRPETSPKAGASSPDALDLVVSVINYRTAEMTLACLRSVLEDFAASGIRGHVVVVDNASGDGSDAAIADWIAAEPEDTPVTLVRSPENTGFSGGHNQGIGAMAAPFYLVLNSDALLRPGFSAAILAAARAAPGTGLFAPRLEDEDGTQQISCFRVPSPASELIRGAASGPVTKLLARWTVPLEMPPAPDQIGWASFACILLRDAMIEEIGPMDEGYFLYFEDTEYCLRARRAGWAVAYVPDARAVHLRGGSAPVKTLARARRKLPRYYYVSRSRLLCQAHGRTGLWAANAAWHLGRAITRARGFLGRPGNPGTEAEVFDIWTGARDPLGRRRPRI